MSHRVTRRDLVVAGLVSVASTQFSETAGAQTPKLRSSATRTRYSATSPKGKENLAKYAKAVTLMKQRPTHDPRSWQFQWNMHWIPYGPNPKTSPWLEVINFKGDAINKAFAGVPREEVQQQIWPALHAWNSCQAHYTDGYDPHYFQEQYFCPWHRHFVYFFEDIVRAVLQDDTFTLPYWDYLSGNVSDLSLPPEFLDKGNSLFHENRNAWVNAGERIDKHCPGAMNLKALDELPYITPDNHGFCPTLDDNPHGKVHDLVGGDMGDIPTAPADPIFWLHHCNIDRLWESWNLLPDTSPPFEWSAFTRMFPFVQGDGTEAWVWPFMASRVELLHYQYDTYYVPPKIARLVVMNDNRLATMHSLAAARAMTRAATSAPTTLDTDRVSISLAPSSHLAGPARDQNVNVWAPPSANRQLYIVLGGIEVDRPSSTAYNVYVNVAEGAAPTGTGERGYVGTLSFFGAVGHQHGAGGAGHRVAFNVTRQIQALRTEGPPKLTFVRRGPSGDTARPTIGHVLLVES